MAFFFFFFFFSEREMKNELRHKKTEPRNAAGERSIDSPAPPPALSPASFLSLPALASGCLFFIFFSALDG